MNGSRKQKTGGEKDWPGCLGNAGLRIGLGMEGNRTGARWLSQVNSWDLSVSDGKPLEATSREVTYTRWRS